MVSTLNNCACYPELSLLESYVRSVLAQREIFPGMETQFRTWRAIQPLSDRDQRLLDLVEDAIASGYVRRARV